jgi:hypothetical protein
MYCDQLGNTYIATFVLRGGKKENEPELDKGRCMN